MNYFITIIKAFIIGSSMSVPGVSGGTMALMLGLYDKLVISASNVFKSKKNLIFLAIFSISALLGIFLVSKPLLILIERFPIIARYFFIGIVLASIPSIYNEAKIEKFNIKYLLLILLSFSLVMMINFIPTKFDRSGFTFEFIAGFISSIGFLLPGISFSYLLLVLGQYDKILLSLSSLDILSLLPFILGFLIGFVLLIKVLEKLFSKYRKITYMLILGFLLGSIYQIYPGLPNPDEIGYTIIVFITGFCIMYLFSANNKKQGDI